MSSISLSASIFMTVSVTVERYWAVCKPAVFNVNVYNILEMDASMFSIIRLVSKCLKTECSTKNVRNMHIAAHFSFPDGERSAWFWGVLKLKDIWINEKMNLWLDGAVGAKRKDKWDGLRNYWSVSQSVTRGSSRDASNLSNDGIPYRHNIWHPL